MMQKNKYSKYEYRYETTVTVDPVTAQTLGNLLSYIKDFEAEIMGIVNAYRYHKYTVQELIDKAKEEIPVYHRINNTIAKEAISNIVKMTKAQVDQFGSGPNPNDVKGIINYAEGAYSVIRLPARASDIVENLYKGYKYFKVPLRKEFRDECGFKEITMPTGLPDDFVRDIDKINIIYIMISRRYDSSKGCYPLDQFAITYGYDLIDKGYIPTPNDYILPNNPLCISVDLSPAIHCIASGITSSGKAFMLSSNTLMNTYNKYYFAMATDPKNSKYLNDHFVNVYCESYLTEVVKFISSFVYENNVTTIYVGNTTGSTSSDYNNSSNTWMAFVQIRLINMLIESSSILNVPVFPIGSFPHDSKYSILGLFNTNKPKSICDDYSNEYKIKWLDIPYYMHHLIQNELGSKLRSDWDQPIGWGGKNNPIIRCIDIDNNHSMMMINFEQWNRGLQNPFGFV